MHLGVDHKTTWFGGIGEGLKAAAVFVPPPFNLIPLGVGAFCSAIAWFFAKDRTTPEANAKPHVDAKRLVTLLVASGVLVTGCTNTKEATRLMAHGAVDGACSVSHRAVDLAFGPINDLERDVTVTVNMVTGGQ